MQTIERTEGREAVAELSDYEKERGKPMPNLSHSIVQTKIAAYFHVRGSDKYLVASELTLELPDNTVLVPDISVLPKRAVDWRREPSQCREVPPLVVEILSPRQGYQEIMDKLDLYFANGVQSAWVMEPAIQAIAIYRPGVEQPALFQRGEATDPATGLMVRLEDVFA